MNGPLPTTRELASHENWIESDPEPFSVLAP